MRKYSWAIIAGACVLALIVMAAIIVPRLSGPTRADGENVELIPGHWWKAELTDDQLTALGTLWGKDITVAQLLQELCPDVLQQIPQEAVTVYEGQYPRWPVQNYGDWQGDFMCGGHGVAHDEGMKVYYYYVGSPRDETDTLMAAADRGFTEDRVYRVSLYTETGLGGYPAIQTERRWSTPESESAARDAGSVQVR